MHSIDKDQIREKLSEYISQCESQNKAARKLGISSAYISQILNGKYEKVGAGMWRKLYKQLQPGGWVIAKTRNYQSLHKLCEDCQMNGLMRAFTGFSGAGKTLASRAYARQNPEVFYVHCEAGSSQRELLEDIMIEMGIEYSGTVKLTAARVTGALLSMEAPLIIFDDAGKLRLSQLQQIQRLYDKTRNEVGEGHLGIVLTGLPYMYDNLRKWSKREKAGAPEIKRRIGYNQSAQPPTHKEVEFIAQHNGVEDPEVISLLARYCKDFGTLAESVRNYLRLPEGSTAEDLEEAIGGKEVAYA